MKIIQITDIHIAKLGQETILDIDVWAKFKNILVEAKQQSPDLLVISGDLCYQSGERVIYEWIKAELDKTGINYRVIAGNHDDSSLMADVFNLASNQDECYYSEQFSDRKILFLDSAKAIFSPKQWAWLQEELVTDQPVMIFMHHPPVLAQTPFMDKNHSFKEMEQFATVLDKAGQVVPVFCGHYHLEKNITQPTSNVFITPSSMAQINGDHPAYTLGHLTPGYRVIDWSAGQLFTEVKYLWNYLRLISPILAPS